VEDVDCFFSSLNSCPALSVPALTDDLTIRVDQMKKKENISRPGNLFLTTTVVHVLIVSRLLNYCAVCLFRGTETFLSNETSKADFLIEHLNYTNSVRATKYPRTIKEVDSRPCKLFDMYSLLRVEIIFK
jgi:hypothetical protein